MPDPADPSAAPDAWACHMRAGAFDAAWAVSDAAVRGRRGTACWHRPRHLQYVWDGTPLDGRRVLVRCYHGLGDTIQFVRYLPLVKAVAAETIVWAQTALLPLLETADGIDRLLPLHDGAPDALYDVDVEIMELPHVFRSTMATLPRRVPYLHAEPTERPRDEADRDDLHVGLVWRSGDWDPRRGVPFAALRPFAAVPGVRWHVLQQNAAAAGWDESFGRPSGRDDVSALAGVMRSLDLIITIDSMPAHLAGALGVPVWTLLHADADWRWGERRADSPWYPTMRLFRQTVAGAWGDVIGDVAAALHAEARSKQSSPARPAGA